MENVNKEIDNLVDYIKNTDDYKKCIKLKDQMKDNSELMSLIDEVKNLQKKYIKSNYDLLIKEELDKKNKELLEIPIYVLYNKHLNNVNYMIDYINNSLNNYFYELLNKNV